MKKIHLFIIILITTMVVSFGLTVTLLNGCSFDSYVEVETGDYMPIDPGSIHETPAANLISTLHVDLENKSIKIMLKDGSILDSSFTARPRQEWPSGCPANLGSTRMEVLNLDVNEITIGNTVIGNPILVRNCPDDPERVILREDGQIGGAGTACAQADTCIHFRPGKPGEAVYNPRILSENE